MLRVALSCLALLVTVSCGSSPASTAGTSQPATAAAATPTVAPTAAATPRPPTTAPIPAFEDATFTGTWTNQTFGSTGGATMAVKVDRAALTLGVTLTLTGNVFGTAAPAPETFTLPINAAGATYTGKSKTFGDVTATLKADGTFTFRGENVPSNRVKGIDGSGTWTTSGINFTYNVALSDGSAAKGVVSLKKS
ncbi:MAG TPA: hypothetical protein VFV20_01390 [Candidatus Limnocylindria bacterium]|nr:hypothetical protein [Candidatus Limnocylindria bacterium]